MTPQNRPLDSLKTQHFYEMKAYRPENLSEHDKLKQYYDNGSSA